jgi:hypothetical protein
MNTTRLFVINVMKNVAMSAALLLSACASTPEQGERPDWIDGSSAQYSASMYLLGVGQADSMTSSKDLARADLAKVFEVNIREQSSDTESAIIVEKDQRIEHSLEQKVTRHISTQTDRVLQGVQIAQTWTDPASHQVYALAVLNRMQAGEIFRQDINSLDHKTTLAVERARDETDILKKIGMAQQALEAQYQRREIQSRYRIVDPSGQGSREQVSAGKLEQDLKQLLARVHIRAESDNAALTTKLSGALAGAGFAVSEGHRPDYILQGSLQSSPVTRIDGVYWLRSVLDLALQDAAQGKAVGSVRWNIKVSSVEQDQLQPRLLNKVSALSKQRLKQTIIDFGAGRMAP